MADPNGKQIHVQYVDAAGRPATVRLVLVGEETLEEQLDILLKLGVKQSLKADGDGVQAYRLIPWWNLRELTVKWEGTDDK